MTWKAWNDSHPAARLHASRHWSSVAPSKPPTSVSHPLAPPPSRAERDEDEDDAAVRRLRPSPTRAAAVASGLAQSKFPPSMDSYTSHRPGLSATSDLAGLVTRAPRGAKTVAADLPPWRCASAPGLYEYTRPRQSRGEYSSHPCTPPPHVPAPASPRAADGSGRVANEPSAAAFAANPEEERE